jgi:tryptophan-rich sensory protein
MAFAASLALPRPLAFFFGRQFATGGDPHRIEQWNAYWQYPRFRSVQRVITVVWAIALVADAGVRIAFAFILPTATMVWLSPTCLYLVLAATITWTFAFGRRSRARAQMAGYDV